jgi:hypothetical protein
MRCESLYVVLMREKADAVEVEVVGRDRLAARFRWP